MKGHFFVGPSRLQGNGEFSLFQPEAYHLLLVIKDSPDLLLACDWRISLLNSYAKKLCRLLKVEWGCLRTFHWGM